MSDAKSKAGMRAVESWKMRLPKVQFPYMPVDHPRDPMFTDRFMTGRVRTVHAPSQRCQGMSRDIKACRAHDKEQATIACSNGRLLFQFPRLILISVRARRARRPIALCDIDTG